MPSLSQYQTVFRVAKPNVPKRGQVSKRRQQANGEHFTGDDGVKEGDSNVAEAQARLQKLEEMVTMLMKSNQDTSDRNSQSTPSVKSIESTATSAQPLPVTASSGLSVSQPTPETNSNGHLDVSGTETKYLGATHYLAILENIKDIQESLAADAVEADSVESGDSSTDVDEPDILLSNEKPLTLAIVLESLPSRQMADRYLSVQFNAKYLHIPFIHEGKFLEEYESFWRDPASVSFLWISILFSALHLGSAISLSSKGQENFPLQQGKARNVYLIRAAQALTAGRYQKARRYSVEATTLYAMCRFFQNLDSDTEPWLLMGVAARLALRMGYHRDPRHLTHISPFEGEMRRRTFSTVQTFELLLSFQAGLPAIIHEQVCDTEPPGNLHDEDFDEFSTSIRPSRPPTDRTPMLYYRYKGLVASTFRKIARQALSPRLPAYQDVMELDAELRQTHSEIPPSLVWKSLSSSIMEETHAIMHRLNLELLYQKSMMINHRRYLSHDRSNPAYQYSRQACVVSSFQVLEHQAEMHHATEPGGQLHNNQWLASSIALHDFLLAGMIACLDLYESYRENRNTTQPAADAELEAKQYDILKLSQEIWQKRQGISPDAKRAASILAVMLSKVPRPVVDRGPSAKAPNVGSNIVSQLPTHTNGNGYHDDPACRAPLTAPAPFDLPVSLNADMDLLATPDLPSQEFLDAVFTDSEMLDWSILDHYMIERPTPVRSFDF